MIQARSPSQVSPASLTTASSPGGSEGKRSRAASEAATSWSRTYAGWRPSHSLSCVHNPQRSSYTTKSVRMVSPSLPRRDSACVRRQRRRIQILLPAPAQPVEHVEIQKMHDAEHHQDGTDFVADQLDGLTNGLSRRAGPQRQGDVAEVDQVETDHQQVVDRIGQFG